MSIDYLKNKNPHERDALITFQDEGHIYTVKGKRGYTSVTTLIHSLFEQFDADKIIDNMMRSSRWSQNKYYGMTKSQLKELWDKNRDVAAEAGTKLHYDIECTYNNMPVVNDSIEYAYFLKFYEDYKHLEPYRTEMLVFDEELQLSGSIDMIFKCADGSLEIYDWKRSKEIVKVNKWNKWIQSSVMDHLPDTNYWHYSLQLNTYKAILMKNYGVKVGNLYLVALHPDNKTYLRIPVADLQDEVQQLFLERKRELANEER
jgi:ATP-dependent exoDNAse (exonuclease V) beta subunit